MDEGFDMGADETHPASLELLNPVAAFLPVKNYRLGEVNSLLTEI